MPFNQSDLSQELYDGFKQELRYFIYWRPVALKLFILSTDCCWKKSTTIAIKDAVQYYWGISEEIRLKKRDEKKTVGILWCSLEVVSGNKSIARIPMLQVFDLLFIHIQIKFKNYRW